MIWLVPDRDAAPLGQLDLYVPSILGSGIMAQGRGWVELEIEHVGGGDFADATNEMAVERKFPSRKAALKTVAAV